MSVPDRFWQKVTIGPIDTCWKWEASRDVDGYGRFQEPTPTGQRSIRAHRWIIEQLVGRHLNADEVVMHSCDNPPCVNPAHLSVGTCLDNNADKVSKGRHAKLWGTPLARSRQTHCKRGHPLSGANLTTTERGHRRCKICAAAASRKHYHSKIGKSHEQD